MSVFLIRIRVRRPQAHLPTIFDEPFELRTPHIGLLSPDTGRVAQFRPCLCATADVDLCPAHLTVYVFRTKEKIDRSSCPGPGLLCCFVVLDDCLLLLYCLRCFTVLSHTSH